MLFLQTIDVPIGLFLICLLIMGFFIGFHQDWMRYASPSVLVACGLSVLFAAIRESKQSIKPNRRNTLLILFITLMALPWLYTFVWHSQLNQRTTTLTEDVTDVAAFPAIAVFQKLDWSSQADISLSTRPKCFIGWFNESASACGKVVPGATCNCNGTWASEVVEPFVWRNTSYRMLLLPSTKDMVSVEPNTILLTQVFFTYNTSKALEDSGRVLSPSLWIAVFDASLTISDALESGLTRLQLVSANGLTSINLGLNQREKEGRSPAYDYQLSMSSTPSTDLICNTANESKDFQGNCWMTLYMQFPTFDRKVFSLAWEMEWFEAFAEAGAWFSFFQIVSWILSGQAIAD